MEIDFQKRSLSFHFTVYKSKILRNDLIKMNLPSVDSIVPDTSPSGITFDTRTLMRECR